MRTMCDACSPANYEAGHDLYASYVDGSCATNSNTPVRISSIGTNAGNVGDCEPGNPAPTFWVDWVLQRRAAGVDPSIYVAADQLGSYFNGYKWQNVRSAFTARGIAEPHYWICYPGFSSIPAGAMAVQTGFMGGFDISLVVDFWPGVDTSAPPDPPPPPFMQGGHGDMIVLLQTPAGRADQLVIGTDGEVFWASAQGAMNIVGGQGLGNAPVRSIAAVYWADYSHIDLHAVKQADGSVWGIQLDCGTNAPSTGWVQVNPGAIVQVAASAADVSDAIASIPTAPAGPHTHAFTGTTAEPTAG